MTISTKTEIHLPFHPYNHPIGHTIEKADNGGKKRRYLAGISSGIKLDAHGERMTSKCIKSFMEQANSGDVLLYPDIHGIKASEDIGILNKAEITPDGDWYTEYRLYDEDDEIGPSKLEKINDLWKQSTGQKPYRKARQKGFSIEGYIPEGAIVTADEGPDGSIGRRVIDDVQLDGVVLVPRPAYKASIANGIYKALGELPPWTEDIIRKDIQGELSRMVNENEMCDGYYRKKWDINDALERTVEKIMSGTLPDKTRQLDIIFDEYKRMMINLIMQSQSVFENTESDPDEEIQPYGSQIERVSKIDLFKNLASEIEKLIKIYQSR